MMTKQQYDQYVKDLLPYIGNSDLGFDPTTPVVKLTFQGIESYEDGTTELPKAVFRLPDGSLSKIELKVALDLLRKGNNK